MVPINSVEKILSKQYAELKFRNGKVEYFSLSTQHGSAKTVEDAINNILEADKKYEGKTPLGYAIEKDNLDPKGIISTDSLGAIINQLIEKNIF